MIEQVNNLAGVARAVTTPVTTRLACKGWLGLWISRSLESGAEKVWRGSSPARGARRQWGGASSSLED